MMRIAFLMSRRQFGKVRTSMRALYPRVPKMRVTHPEGRQFWPDRPFAVLQVALRRRSAVAAKTLCIPRAVKPAGAL
jgi:hypothetical protein